MTTSSASAKQHQGFAWRLPLLGSAALLAILVALIYSPGLSGDFVFDDFANIVANKKIHAETLDFESLARAASAYQGPIGRPLATVGFAIDYAVGGKDPFAFKLHSLIVHLLNSLLVFLLCRRLLAHAPVMMAARTWMPLALGAAWALHPIQVSSVLYVVQRMEMLAALFMLLGLLAYLRGRSLQMEGRGGWSWIVLAFACAGIGLLAKETPGLFPFLTLALELTILQFRATDARVGRLLKLGYACFTVVALLLYFGVIVPRYGNPGAFANRDFSLYERLLSQFRVLPTYIGQMLLPLPDSMPFYYDDYPKSTGWLAPLTTLLGALFLAALATLAWACRKKAALLALGIMWFFIPHLLTSGAVNLELAFEHRNYLPLLGIVIAVAGAATALPLRPSPESAATAAGVIVLMLAALCGIRAATWGDPLVLAMDMVSRNPDSARASSDLGAAYARLAMESPDSSFLDLALAEFERGSHLPGASPLPEQGLILLSAGAGREVRDAWWDRLEAKLRSNPIGPQEVMSVTGILNERLKGLDIDDARLASAYMILAERGGATAEAYLGFAYHADNYLQAPELAERLYVAAMASPSMTPEYAQRILFSLATDGKSRYLEAAAMEAKRRGLVAAETP